MGEHVLQLNPRHDAERPHIVGLSDISRFLQHNLACAIVLEQSADIAEVPVECSAVAHSKIGVVAKYPDPVVRGIRRDFDHFDSGFRSLG